MESEVSAVVQSSNQFDDTYDIVVPFVYTVRISTANAILPAYLVGVSHVRVLGHHFRYCVQLLPVHPTHSIAMHKLRERPILFNEFSTKANLAGRKSVTRRDNGLKEINENPDNWPIGYVLPLNPKTEVATAEFEHQDGEQVNYARSPWKRGDLLWGRETCSYVKQFNGTIHREKTKYRADEKWDGNGSITWKPSIFMPKAVARQWAICTGVRVERLFDITEESAIAEGVEKAQEMDELPEFEWNNYTKYRLGNYKALLPTAVDSYRSLLADMNSLDWVNKNPWLWVVEYDLISTTGRPSDELIQQTLTKHNIKL